MRRSKVFTVLPNIIRMIRRKKRLEGYLGIMRRRINVWQKKLTGGKHSEDLGIDGRIIIKYTLGI
jgi:hypothetical protein